MKNLAQLIEHAARVNPSASFGTFQQNDRLDAVVSRARRLASGLREAGLRRGDVVAVIGPNSAAYIVHWLAAQLAGIRTALINPHYPDEFLATMLDDLDPRALVWVGRDPGSLLARPVLQIDAANAWSGEISVLRADEARSDGWGTGHDCSAADIAAYIHTSGTTGNPKFCALSHGYFLRLGRYFADVMGLGRFDLLVNPLPLFHINPIGNGLTGALTACAGFLSSEKFSTEEYWPMVKAHGATAIVLHGPPASMLKTRTTREEAAGHKVRIGFFCDPDFLEQFDIPIGVGGYGSTEAGGYCHSQKFRAGDRLLPPEGAMHLSGQPRADLECTLSDDGEILVRGRNPQTLFSGYYKGGTLDERRDAEGWFHTGDRGRWDEEGNLIFIERASDSIRVNAEYVPLDLVEGRLKQAASLGDFALWRVDSPTKGHEPVIYTTARDIDPEEVKATVSDLPRYMHPTRIIAIAAIPRDAGVGKIQRRLLGEQPVLQVREL